MSYTKLPWQYGFLGDRSREPLGDATPTPVFDVDLQTTITPSVGTAGTLTRASTEYYFDSVNTIGTKTSGNALVPAYMYGMSEYPGTYLQGATTNYAQYSEALNTAPWSNTGTVTITDGVGTFLVGGSSITYSTIASSASYSGAEQDIGVAAASKNVLISCFAQSSASAGSIQLTIEGQGATPETSSKTYYFDNDTTGVLRIFHYKKFTSGATGDIKIAVEASNGLTVKVGGVMVEDIPGSAGTDRSSLLRPSSYVKTTGATANRVEDLLSYTGTELSSISGAFTIAGWFNPFAWPGSAFPEYGGIINATTSIVSFNDATYANSHQMSFWTGGATTDLYMWKASDGEYWSRPSGVMPSLGTWRYYAYSWNGSEGVAYVGNTFDFYTLTSADIGSGFAQPTITGLYFQGGSSINSPQKMPSLYGRWQMYNSALTAAQIETLYDAQKASYGHSAFSYGYPAAQTVSTGDATLQYLFDESSGSIVDEVSSTTLTVNASPTFSVTGNATGNYSGLASGITYGATNTTGHIGSSLTDFSPGTSNMTFELWFSTTDTTGSNMMFRAGSSASDYVFVYYGAGATSYFRVAVRDTAVGLLDAYFPFELYNVADGKLHKLRVAITRSTSVEVFLDGISLGTSSCIAYDMAAWNDLVLANETALNDGFVGTFYEWRYTKSATANSGGPNGG